MECPACHTLNPAGASFCTQCGAPLAAASHAAPAYTEVPPAYTPPADYAYANTPPPPPVTGASGLTPNIASALAYVTVIPAILFLVIEPYNRNPLIRFHSVQSICYAVVCFVLWTALRILYFIPFIGLIFILLNVLLSIALFILWVMVILRAAKGEYYRLPIIGDFALKQSQQL